MRTYSTKSKIVVAAVTAGTLGVSGVAYAYWTTTGAGTGSATAGSVAAADKISLAQIGTLTGFYPGSTPQPVMVRATNPAAFSQKVGNVTVVVAAVGACASSNWDVVDSADAFGIVAAGASSPTLATSGLEVATIQLKDTTSNQDACQGVSPQLTFTSAAGAL